MQFAALFPGQGAQFVGMGADLFEARPDLLGDTADQILGWSLRGMCLEGPEEALTRTEHAQPALFATAYALWAELDRRLGSAPAGAAGHSLGEYTALAAAGAISFEDGLALVAARGAAMAAAADAEPGGMAALIGADADGAEAIAQGRRNDGGRLWVANLNAPGQVVVAGAVADIEWVVEEARTLGIRRAIPLDVAGAFHSPLMESAAEKLKSAVVHADPGTPRFPVWANFTGRPHQSGVGEALLAQLTGTVRFSESLQDMARAGVETFVHVGPGDVTAGLAKRSVEGTEPIVVSGLHDLDAAIDRLEG